MIHTVWVLNSAAVNGLFKSNHDVARLGVHVARLGVKDVDFNL